MSEILGYAPLLEHVRKAIDQSVDEAVGGLQEVLYILDTLLLAEDDARCALSGDAERYAQRKQHQCRRILALTRASLGPLLDDLATLSRQASTECATEKAREGGSLQVLCEIPR